MMKPFIFLILAAFNMSNLVTARAAPAQNQTAQAVSVFETDMSKAQCRSEFPSEAQMRQELDEASKSAPFMTTGVGGLSILNENQRLGHAYRMLVSYKDYKFNYVTDIDYWSLFRDGDCHKALCAAEKVFGAKQGLYFLYIAWKYGLIMSPFGFERLKPPTPNDEVAFKAYFSVRPWRDEEMAVYLRALPMIPKNRLPLPWTRFNLAGIDNPLNPKILSNGIIVLYASLEKLSEENREHAVFHEVGHVLGASHRWEISPDWMKASGWEVQDNGAKKQVVNVRPDEFVSRYSKVNIFEDFAESYTFYRYNPETLLRKSPRRYQYLRDVVFEGREYLPSSTCVDAESKIVNGRAE